MPEDVRNSDGSSTALEAALTGLDRALAEASSAVATIRNAISQVTALEEKARNLETRARELEAAMMRARESLSIPLSASSEAAPSPHLRPVPPWETSEEPAQPQADITETVAPVYEPEAESSQPAEVEAEPAEPAAVSSEASQPTSHCLRLDVSKKVGSLDLKVVDGSVNESPAVTDVALLDYDGRHATLKLWISEAEDPDAVRTTLLKSLRSKLGGESLAEVRIEFEEESAA